MRRSHRFASILALFTLVTVIPLSAGPVFVNGLLIPGNSLDATGLAGANVGRFGFFSDIYYDVRTNQWWAISDRGPGGGLLNYDTRLTRFTMVLNPVTGRISEFTVLETVKFTDPWDCSKGPAPR